MKSPVHNCKTLPPLQHTLPSLLLDAYAEPVRWISTFSDYSAWQLEGKAFSTSTLSRGPAWSNSGARKTARGVCTGGEEKETALAAAEKPIRMMEIRARGIDGLHPEHGVEAREPSRPVTQETPSHAWCW